MATGSQNMTTFKAKGLTSIANTVDTSNFIFLKSTAFTADQLGNTVSLSLNATAVTGAAMTNHSLFLNAGVGSGLGTPFQLQIPDASHLYIYKRWYSSGAWSGWSKISAGHADLLTTARSLWGNSFDGSANIGGTLTPDGNRTRNIGSNTAMWNDAHIRGIATRHIDAADQAYLTDGGLHIGYGSVAPTKAIYLYYSADTSSRTKFFEVNSNGAYAVTRFGVNGQDTGYNLYVNGTTWHTGNIYLAAAKHIYMSYNSTNYNILHNHNNGNISVNAAGTGLYMAYQNTTFVNWMNGRMELRDGCLSLFPNNSSYREGLRIHATGSWSDITLCGNDNTGNSGISANSWFLGNNNGDFYIARNGSSTGTSLFGCVGNVWRLYTNADMPEGAANISGACAGAHYMTIYRNAILIPYQMDNANDGGFFRVRGTSESTCIAEIGTWDDSGAGETIQFNYYSTSSQVTPTYSVSVPKHSGTLVTTDGHGATGTWGISITGNAATATTASKITIAGGTGGTYYKLIGVPSYASGAQDVYVSSPAEVNNTTLRCSHIAATAGYLTSTANGNTVTIGSQNTGWCHFQNSVDIPFYFNRQITIDGNLMPYTNTTRVFGDGSHEWTQGAIRVVYARHFDSSLAFSNDYNMYYGYNRCTNHYFYRGATGGGQAHVATININGITSNYSIGVAQTDGTSNYGISLYGGTGQVLSYGILFATTGHLGKHGMVTSDWATYFTMDGSQDRGWIFRSAGGNVASISAKGHIQVNGNIYIGSSRAGGYLNGGATNGGINSIMIGDDVWLGDCNAGGIMGMKSTGANTGFYFYNSGGTQTGQIYTDANRIHFVKSSSDTFQFDFNGAVYIAGMLNTGGIRARGGLMAQSDHGSGNCAIWFTNIGNSTGYWKINIESNDRMSFQHYDSGTLKNKFWINTDGTTGSASSRKIKHNIQNINFDTGRIIDKMQPVSYIVNGDLRNKTTYGFIYEDLVQILPDVCDNQYDTVGITYTAIIPVLTKEIQNLRKRLAAVETELSYYRSKT